MGPKEYLSLDTVSLFLVIIDFACSYLLVNCFAGGNFLLGGQVLGQQKYIDFGLVSIFAESDESHV